MKRLICLAACTISVIASASPPEQPLATGRYEFRLRSALHPGTKDITLIAEIIDDHIELTNSDLDEVYDFGVIAEGTLMWHAATQQWIIGNSDEDRNATDVAGRSGGPHAVDLAKLEYWTC